MCAACGCGKKKGEPGFGKGPKSKKAAPKDKSTKQLSPKQKKIAAVAGDKNKIDGADFKALRKKAK
jgi:hypothetical protein